MMFEFQVEKDRRIAQFARFIELMELRRNEEAKSDCFLIFDDCSGKDSGMLSDIATARKEIRQPVCFGQSALTGLSQGFGGDGFLSNMGPVSDYHNRDLMNHEYNHRREDFRFVQFCFKEKRFTVDLPNTTLVLPEAERLLHERSGFFREAEAPDKGIDSHEYIRKFDPVMKHYIYKDERSAAEDAAFIFFDLWLFPVDSRLFVKASSFRTHHRWEEWKPIE